MAAPLGLSQFSRLNAQEATGDHTADALMGDKELMHLARVQLDNQQYEQAEKALAAVKTANLSEKERDEYIALLSDAKHAATERRSAREELASGDDAVRGQQTLDAVAHFKAAATNQYADAQTLAQAKSRLHALHPEWGTTSEAALPATPAAFESPAQPAVLSAPTTQPATGARQGGMTGKQYYELGVAQYRKSDWAGARQSLRLAQAAGYKPASLYQDPPAEILKRMDQREQSDRERVQHLDAAGANPTTAPADGTGAAADNGDPLSALKATAESEKVRHNQAVAQAREWVSEAGEAAKAQNYDRALDLYTKAADADPSNAAAVQGRDDVLRLLGRNPSPANLPNAEAERIKARQGEITYQIQSNLDQARAAIQQEHWGDAQIAIDRARLAASADPTIFPAQTIRGFNTQIANTEADLRQAQERVTTAQNDQTAKAVQIRIESERETARRQRQRTIADLIHTAQQLTSQGRYREALQTVDQILILDPVNDYAVGVKPLLEDKNQFAEQRQFMETRNRKTTTVLNSAEEALTPYDDILRYPADWPDISQTRDATVASERGGNNTDRAVQAQLDRQLPELAFDAVGFNDVVDFLRDVSGSNVFVNWKSLEAAGIDRNTPVTARLHNIKFSKALNIILDSVGGGQTKLGYTVDEGVITISTAEDLSKNVVVRVYDIRDLIIDVPDFLDAPQFSLEAAQNGGQQSSSGAGGGGQQGQVSNMLFAGGGQGVGLNAQKGPTREELVESITKLIEDTVTTDSWKDNGGSVGALRELQGQLIVTQTPENHRQLVNLLEQLREERAIQVTIETRFLTVQRNFLQDVGVDLNFLFNLNNSWSKHLGTIPLTTPNSTFTMNPTTGVQGSIGSGTTTPTGLTTSATYLDDFQVQLMLRAVEASVNSSIVTAPRITLFNGQRAYVLVSIQRAYVSNLTPVVSTGISSFAPTIGIVQSGVLLDVQATVSADRKYVTLTLRPQLANLLDLANFTFQVGASGTAGNGVGGIGGNGFGFVGGVAPTGVIQEPELQITEVKTTVSIPDGGTLLLGGQTLAGETEREIGVPVLSKIPFLKRLFTNRSMAKDEQVLLILCRPTIILQREIEQKQFPLLTSHLTNNGG